MDTLSESKPRALGRQPVDVWRAVQLGAESARVVAVELDDKDEDEVRPIVRRVVGRRGAGITLRLRAPSR